MAKKTAPGSVSEAQPTDAAPSAATVNEGVVNKAAVIKAAMEANPTKTPTQISAMLVAQGLDVTPSYVSRVKTGLKYRHERIVAAKKASSGKTPAAKDSHAKAVSTKTSLARDSEAKSAPAQASSPTLSRDGVSVSLLVKAKRMVDELGGIERAKSVLQALAQLTD